MFPLRSLTIFRCFQRHIMVGPSKGLPTVKAVPSFGKHLQPASLKSQTPLEPDPSAEMRAEQLCKNSYGFLRRPLFLNSWTEFQKELQRVELQWSLAPGHGGVVGLKLFDHHEPGNGLLCELKGNCSNCTPIADFFECCGSLLTGLSNSCSVRFVNELSEFTLLVDSERFIESSKMASINSTKEDLTHTIGLGTMVNVAVVENKTNIRSALFHKISLLTLNYAFLTSIPIFLKRNDIGVRNVDFVSKDHMRHFRFAWCFIRSRSSMTPVDMTELDCLLPP